MKRLAVFAVSMSCLLGSCSQKNKTPAQAAENGFKALAKGDFEGASKFFPDPKSNLEWAKSYYGRQELAKIFNVTIQDTAIFGSDAVVTYTPAKTLVYDFDGRNLVLMSRKNGGWTMDLQESSRTMSSLGMSGRYLDVMMLTKLVDKATKKQGTVPANMQQVLHAEEEPSMFKRISDWAENYEYFPEGAEKGGEKDVIFYSREPYPPGLYSGISKTRYFISDGSKVLLTMGDPSAAPH